ncbi:MAG: DUF1523 family protein [Pseudomonadota bacterium]
MALMRKLVTTVGLMAVLLLAGLLAYVLPRHHVVYIDGIEVRRDDGTLVTNPGVAPQYEPGIDMYYVYAVTPDRNEVLVFRNEDTGFGFPWYLKMDAAEVQGRAQLLTRKDDQLALVTYYGWRIPVLKLFPNAVDVEAWDRAEEPWPVFNITFLTLLAIAVGGLAWKLRRWRRARAARKQLQV